MNTSGERISALREKLKLTQGELAKQLDITRASLSHYENNRRVPDYDTLRKFADFFNVSVDYLVGREEQPNQTTDAVVKEFTESLELSDDKLLEKFTLTVDGRELTPEEARRFIAFIRAERSLN
ncbi:helix-turn-helix domain-containing protein [Paenibacillus thermotolerans]|uniref:helix-turn-helix domain-containing protein n=1 Tax=Paenibacillus thermotolerans TaxID=3027807 RepID=UPI002367A148|nr:MULTISPECIES: helix-turn-helix transcriptional regulator [unclassified Paenibacillus]